MKSLVALVLLASASCVLGHSYNLGSCPLVEPASGFDMSRFLGKWYVIEKFSTASKCLTYNFSRTADGKLEVEQTSEHFLLGLTSVDHKYRYTGSLEVPDPSTPAKMIVRFPLSVAGSASYVVFSTDYENYAGIFTCQKMAFANRQSASILSRRPSLDRMFVDKVRNKLNSLGVNPHDFSIIDQTDCSKEADANFNINIDDDTFSAHNVATVVRTAGEKIGDGIEAAVEGAKNIYDRVNRDGEKENVMHPDAEWIP